MREQNAQKPCGTDEHGKLKGVKEGQCAVIEIIEETERSLERQLRDFG